MQSPGREKPPVGIVFDSDMGHEIDVVLALAMLHSFSSMENPEARLVSVSVSRSNLKAAAFCEAVSNFYSEVRNRELPPRFRRSRSLPVGLSVEGPAAEDTPMLTAPLSKRSDQGEPLYSHEIHKLNDTAEVAALIRNAFTAQHDQNSIVVLSGPATNLARVLDLRGAKQLIANKVRFLSIAAGAYPAGEPEFNVRADIPAARKVFAEWPTPIIACGHEIGAGLLYPASSIETDFGWTPHHPVVDAYRAHREMPYDAPTWAMAAVLYAVRPEGGYFDLSDPGTIRVLDDGRTRFEASHGGKHRYLILDPARKERIIRTYREITSAQPPPREPPGFIRALIEEEKKKEEEKKRQEQQKQQRNESPETQRP